MRVLMAPARIRAVSQAERLDSAGIAAFVAWLEVGTCGMRVVASFDASLDQEGPHSPGRPASAVKP